MTDAMQSARTRVMSVRGASWLQRLVEKVKQDDVLGMSAEIAYHWIFAIPPLVILVVMSGALVDEATDVQVVERLRTQINDRAPADTASVLNRLVDNAVAEVGGGAASFGMVFAAIIALWSGSNAVGALMKAFNRAYMVDESRPFVRKRVVAVGLTLLLIGILNAAFFLLVYGRKIGDWLADKIGASDAFEVVWSIIQWPVAILGIVAVIGLLYSIGPNIDRPLRWVTPGSIAATAMWLVLVLGFGIYLRFSDPGSAYGVLGGVIVLLFFLYLTSAVLLVGAEIDATAELESE
jgi:membrane protein